MEENHQRLEWDHPQGGAIINDSRHRKQKNRLVVDGGGAEATVLGAVSLDVGGDELDGGGTEDDNKALVPSEKKTREAAAPTKSRPHHDGVIHEEENNEADDSPSFLRLLVLSLPAIVNESAPFLVLTAQTALLSHSAGGELVVGGNGSSE